MKTFQKFLLLLAVLPGFHLCAQTNDVVKFSGTVVDAQGKSVADASVDCYQFPSRAVMAIPEMESKQQAVTDGKGAFAFSISRQATLVVVKKAGLAPAWKMWQSAPSGAVEPLVLTAPAALAGVVVDENGGPIADAEVSVSLTFDKPRGVMTQPNLLSGKPAGDLFSARTDADGHFRIGDFPAEAQANLTVTKPGRALHQTAMSMNGLDLPNHAGQEDIKLVMDPAASIEGRVVFRDAGAPLAHARVQLQPVNPWGGFSTTSKNIQSDADGAFRISDVSPGSYHVTAVSANGPVPAWVAESVSVTVAAGETARDVRIQAFQGGVVEVTVVAKTGQKILPGVNVSAYSQEYQAGSPTGTNGVAFFRLPPGQFSLNAMQPGLSQAQAQVAVAEGQTNQIKLELNSPNKIAGTLRDASGAPVANASVNVFPNYGGDNSQAKSDASGHYEATWQQPGWAGMQNQRYYLVARNEERNLAAVQEIDENASNLDLVLKPGMSVSARVQDTRGKAITNATGFLMVHMENMSFTINRQPLRSDGPGGFRVDALPLGQLYGMQVMAKGYGTTHVEMDAADPKADHYEFPPIVVKLADRKLAGRVLGADGKPAAGAQVWMNGEGQPNGNAMTDENGRFAFDGVCEGAVNVNANSKGVSGSAEAMGGNTNMVVRLNANNFVSFGNGPSLTLTGTVLDPSGNPAVGVRVTVMPGWGTIDTGKSDTKGEYSVKWRAEPAMRNNNVKYFVIARDVERGLVAIEEIDTNKTQVSLSLQPGLSISGSVQDANGAPLTRANINLNMMAGNMGGMVDPQPVKISPDGTFTIPALPMGQRYLVFVSANGYGSARRSISGTQSQTNIIQLSPLKLRAADRQLAGQVQDKDGKPLAGVNVNIFGNNQPSGGSVRTDATGHFKFKVCAGPVSVNAFLPGGGGRNNYASVRAHGGDTDVIVKMGAPPQRQTVARQDPLKPRPWTLNAVILWPANHKSGAIILASLQAVVLLGTGGGIFWFTRKRGR